MEELTASTSRVYAKLGQAGAAFGVALVELAKQRDDIVVLSADMAKPAGLLKFSGLHPDRFFNVGIAEQNLVGMAAGFANEGFKVIASAQACFLSMRSYEQIRQYSGYMKFPIVYVGVSAGFALTFFGNTHYALEDMTLLRSIPGMVVISPSDPGQAMKALQQALTMDSPVYIRCTGVPGLPPLYTKEYAFEIGKAIQLKEGLDATVFCCGAITRQVVEVANELEDSGYSVRVVDMHTISPLDQHCLQHAMASKLWITVEEHFVQGGLGSAVAEFLATQFSANRPYLHCIGVPNAFTVPGDYAYLLRTNQLDAASLKARFIALLQQVADDE